MKYFSNEIRNKLNTVSMSSDEVTDSARKYKKSKNANYKDKYRGQVVDGTMRLVYKTCSGYGFSQAHFDDAFQYGVIGVLEALDRFDPDMNMKFSTYAVYWIKHYLNLAKNEITVIKLPRDNHIASSKYEAIQGMAISNNISDEAAAVRMGIKKKNVKGLKKDHALSSKLKFTYSTDMESTIGASANPDKLFYGGILKDKSMGHDQQFENEDMISRVNTVAKKYLKTKEYMVFREKFLGEDGEIKANLEVARNLEIPYSSINDILNRAIRKVRIKIKNGE